MKLFGVHNIIELVSMVYAGHLQGVSEIDCLIRLQYGYNSSQNMLSLIHKIKDGRTFTEILIADFVNFHALSRNFYFWNGD